jgi:hypothetical protein
MKRNLKSFLIILIVITIVLTTFSKVPAIALTDLKSTDASYDAVQKMLDLGVMTVDKENKFYPNSVVTRATVSKMLVTLMKYKLSSGNTFTDTSKHWAKQYIETAVKQGIISIGEYGKTFKPDMPITRLELAHMIAKALKLGVNYSIAPFTDVKQDGLVNSTYQNYIFRGSVKDKNRYFGPKDLLTRSQISTVLYRVYCFISDKQTFLSTQRKLLTNDKSFIKATPDIQFESFMKSPQAENFVSTRCFRVENGVVIFKDYANEGYGEMVMDDARNKNVNKIVYNVIKNMVVSAKKYGKYVRVLYIVPDDTVDIQYYNYKSLSDADIQDGNLVLRINLKPFRDTEKQNFDSIYSWNLNKLWLLADDRGYPIQKNMVEEQYGVPLNTMFKDVYGQVDGTAFYNYSLVEYRAECIQGSKRTNYSIIKINGYSVANLNDAAFRVFYVTNLK